VNADKIKTIDHREMEFLDILKGLIDKGVVSGIIIAEDKLSFRGKEISFTSGVASMDEQGR